MLPCPKGCESALAQEVKDLDIEVGDVRPTAVHVLASLQEGYRLCLWSRVASRVLLPILELDADDDMEL